ncbi:transglycosylase SLT domain-containing protein [Nitratidesulfovibrio vulgaris]|uniref:Lysozyme, putative n=1 Tax=Nitratidesulfovibrio vulgaris (strain ATCC 29579 / DSM 644 / CCUG 34227 / NCIMB 8303 / VKM B-1760 / Hildenborough) TaxID=882 RepID=Q72D03_NITV2|nr:transglycosylase SLT domain-containing protein [Nitratidesulfovibrio vulgaris]AAS95608.1 lysozyme, putative [Nitratidesulfovibrio vulgaris str. Hildenborough]ADP86211.1 Lytic transglycosylase catalytic [Nitratidesulfovibrio vulgaris RCH1]
MKVRSYPALPTCMGCCLLLVLALMWTSVTKAAPSIPAQALQHRYQLIREARVQWGMSAPTATFAAQIHQESTWNADAVSPVGAQGLAQFMPATARWLPQVAPDTGKPLPFNPAWSLRALVTYDRWLWQRVQAVTPCDRMAMTLAAYNGGLGWVQRDARLAAARGLDARRWWDNVETVNAGRNRAALTENRGYPRRILLTLEPAYMAAGWGGGICSEGGRHD